MASMRNWLRRWLQSTIRTASILHLARPRVELLEDRLASATFTVLNTSNLGAGSLRQAILDANAAAGSDTIAFAIPGAGVHTINLTSALPALAGPVTVNGATEPGFAGSPLIELNGATAGAGVNGLTVNANGCTIRGFVINHFTGNGILLQSSNNTIAGNFIGTNSAGTAAAANANGIVIVAGKTSNTIGGTTASDANLLSGNTKIGVLIAGVGANNNHVLGNKFGNATVGNGLDAVNIQAGAKNNIIGDAASHNEIVKAGRAGVLIRGAGTTGNSVLGNFIGTDSLSTAGRGNTAGIWIFNGAQNNTIGSTLASGANVISGNKFGILVSGVGTTGNVVQSNLIGLNVAGTAALANTLDGIVVYNQATANRIGGTIAGAANTISGNENGITIDGRGVSGNLVQNNVIGLNLAGAAAIANANFGVRITNDASTNTVQGNTISGNSVAGVQISGGIANANVIKNNFIGLNLAHTAAVGNQDGVQIQGGTLNNVMLQNVISGNVGNGIHLQGFTTGNIIKGNFIGTNVAGTAALPNGQSGILADGGAGFDTIGGATPADRNIISGNTGDGITLSSQHMIVRGNYIGTDVTGAVRIGNNRGIALQGFSQFNTIGPGNVITGSTVVDVILDAVTDNVVKGNLIGLNAAGTTALSAAGAGIHGVLIQGNSQRNTIGGTTAADRNIISGHTGEGVELTGLQVMNNSVFGNFIGTDVTGAVAVANLDGVMVIGSAVGNRIGGNSAAVGNVISGNTRAGIDVNGGFATTIQNNIIGARASGSGSLGNGSHGVYVVNGATLTGISNNLIAFNGGDGVIIGHDPGAPFSDTIDASTGNSVSRNRIFGNAGQAIDLGANNGVTANDAGDVDTGPNGLQNFPVLFVAMADGASLEILGALNSVSNQTFTIEFFSGSAPGQAEKVIGSVTETTTSSGNGGIHVSLPITLAPGSFVVATATDSGGNTSELSAAIAVS